MDFRIWSLLDRIKFKCQRNCQVNRTLHQQVLQDLRVYSLFCYFLQLLDVVDNFSHRHVMEPSNPFILFCLNLFLLFQLHQHHVNVFFFLLFCSIQALYLTIGFLDIANKKVLQLLARIFFLFVLLPKLPLFPDQLTPYLSRVLDLIVNLAQVLQSQVYLMLHAEVHCLRSIVLVRHLSKPNLLHSALHIILIVFVAFLLIHVGLVLILALQLMSVFNPKESVDLRLVTAFNIATVLSWGHLIDLVHVFNALSAPQSLSRRVFAFLLDDL